jgi:hypothetical protein
MEIPLYLVGRLSRRPAKSFLTRSNGTRMVGGLSALYLVPLAASDAKYRAYVSTCMSVSIAKF